jgi:HK97 family phage major capsid protein
MLESVKIAKRQSQIRQSLAELAGAETLNDEQRSKIDDLDRQYQDNERKFRAALISEDTERRDAGAELETRGGREWADLCAGFELRQAALHLDEGRAMTGRTLEVVTELRQRGGYRGVPVPLEALETRAGETVAGGVMNPLNTRPVIDRIFADSVATRMGASFINVGVGETEVPVTTSAISASWAATETGDVGGPTAYETVDRPMKPHHTLGVQVSLTRRALMQAGPALEAAIRRDLAGTIRQEADKAAFIGTGSGGQPTGLLNIAGVPTTAVGAVPTYDVFLDAITAFMVANAITSPSDIRLLMRPETFKIMEGTINEVMQMTEYYRTAFLFAGREPTGTFPPNFTVTSNSLPAPAGDPLAVPLAMTTATGGVPPFFVGLWGAVDMIRDPYSDAKSGGVRLTALTTMDVSLSRTAQTRILTGLRTVAAG